MNTINVNTRLYEIIKWANQALLELGVDDTRLQLAITAIEVHIEAIRHEIGEPDGLKARR